MSIYSVSFLFLYPITNFLGQSWILADLDFGNLISHDLSVRIASLILAFKAFPMLYTSFSDFSIIPGNIEFFSKFSSTSNNLTSYTEIQRLTLFKDEEKIIYFQILQNTFYLFILIVLWIFLGTKSSNLWSNLSSTLIFFIIDDWAIISDYYSSLKGRVINKHIIKIFVINFIILAFCFMGIINSFSYLYGIIFIFLTGVVLISEMIFYFGPPLTMFGKWPY